MHHHTLYNGSSGTFLPVKELARDGNCQVRQRKPDLPRQRQTLGRQAQHRHRRRRVPGPGRTFRLWQVHQPADARGARRGQRRRYLDRWPKC